jgi:hypothetical protein
LVRSRPAKFLDLSHGRDSGPTIVGAINVDLFANFLRNSHPRSSLF